MLLKFLLGIKCHSQYKMVIRLLQHSSAIVKSGDALCVTMGYYNSLGRSRIQFHSTKDTPRTNPAKATDLGFLLE